MQKPDLPPSSPRLFDEDASRRLLSYICATVLALLILGVIAALLLGNTRSDLRLPPALIGIGAAITLVGIQRGHAKMAGQFLMWGTWAVVLAGAPMGSGNRSIGMVVIPLLIVMQGWLIGPRHAIAMTAASIAALLGVSLSEHYGWIAMAGPLPPLIRWMMLCAILLTAGFLTVLSHRIYLARYTEQKRLAATLAMVTEHSPVMLAAVDSDGRYRYVNRNYANFHGQTPEALIGLPAADTVGSDSVAQTRLLLGNGKDTATYRSRRHNQQTGTERWLETSIQRATDGEGEHGAYYAILRDITDEVLSAEQITFLAYHDPLTRLPNRTLLADRLRQAIARSEREDTLVAVCYLDLDGFKLLNDTWGHTIGDLVLIQAASRLQEGVRGTDTVARLGGDEFVVLIGGIEDRQETLVAIERLLATLTKPINVEQGMEVSISASMGVAIYPLDGENPDVLLRHADQAMLTAKQSGRRRFTLFDTELERRTHTFQQMTSSVEKGLAGGEFRLYYQPKVNMRLGTVVGAEALIRWAHPDEGMLQPASFLPHIEGSPVATQLGEWVLAEALAQMGQWAIQGLNLPVSVNISGHHLQAPDFTQRLAALLDAHPDVAPERLEIEILETSVMEDLEKVARIIRATSALGVSFALDDFGTGYSSLTYFRRLPAQTLKIDKSFVRDILDDQEDLAIVKGVVALADSFGRQVIAEGLETVEHGLPLLSIGCDYAQGYGIAHPMPADVFPAWVANWRAPALWRQKPAGR